MSKVSFIQNIPNLPILESQNLQKRFLSDQEIFVSSKTLPDSTVQISKSSQSYTHCKQSTDAQNRQQLSSSRNLKQMLVNITAKGSCTNHVDRILDNFDPLPQTLLLNSCFAVIKCCGHLSNLPFVHVVCTRARPQ